MCSIKPAKMKGCFQNLPHKNAALTGVADMVSQKAGSVHEDLPRIPDSTTWSECALDRLFMLSGPAASCAEREGQFFTVCPWHLAKPSTQ